MSPEDSFLAALQRAKTPEDVLGAMRLRIRRAEVGIADPVTPSEQEAYAEALAALKRGSK